MSQSEKTVTFGLGDEDLIDSLFIFWPNGLSELYQDISSNQEITILEKSGVLN